METHVSSNDTLLPITRLLLGVSAAVQFLFAAISLLFPPDLWQSILWPPPLPPWPDVVREFSAISYLATAIAAAYALYQGTWGGGRVYFAFSFPYNAMAIIVALITAVRLGVPPIMWLYVLLAVLYLPVVAVVWALQARRVRLRS